VNVTLTLNPELEKGLMARAQARGVSLEPIWIWSDPRTTPAKLILNERLPNRYTNVLSEYNRLGGPDAAVKEWLETTDRQSQYLSVITLAEIQKGIELLPDGKRRFQLEQWLKQDLEAWFSGRILGVDRQVARCWATLVAQRGRAGRPLPTIDSLIAATALAYDLAIVTRNTRDFESVGAIVINPWKTA
jgi:hypothetical protein